MDLAAIIIGLVIGILTDELLAWSPRLAAWLVKQNAKQLPAHLRDRMCEEWLAHLDEIPGRFSKLVFAIDTMRASNRMSIHDTPFDGVDGVFKHMEDIIVASICLVVVAIPMMLIAVGIRLSSPGPILFKQLRYGINGETIDVWKFRTMTVCEDGASVNQAKENDPRVTKLGRFLRRTSMDELPQFINVLQGQMSIVGPRPHAVAHNEEYRSLLQGYMLRHKVKPGITGWAQINGLRGETDTIDKMQRRLQFDLHYIRSWSPYLDLKVILLTMFKVFVGKK